MTGEELRRIDGTRRRPRRRPRPAAATTDGVGRARAEVLAAVRDGAGVEGVEQRLQADRSLSQESRSALWLLAWAATERQEIRRCHAASCGPK